MGVRACDAGVYETVKPWTAKDIRVAPVSAQAASALVRRVHYSGKVVNNSQLHLGVWLGNSLEGAMQFGCPMDKRKSIGLVKDTPWNGMMELNRMAFSDRLPRNSESRALGVAMRLIRKAYPHIEWILSFADGTQCGDGTIYRAAGFVLTKIGVNKTLIKLPDGQITSDITMKTQMVPGKIIAKKTLNNPNYVTKTGSYKLPEGAITLPGYQLRYVYFLDPTARSRLTVEPIPFAKIAELGAGMYRGEKRAGSIAANAPADQAGEGRAALTPALQTDEIKAGTNVSEG
jgi:hypothetical protein